MKIEELFELKSKRFNESISAKGIRFREKEINDQKSKSNGMIEIFLYESLEENTYPM